MLSTIRNIDQSETFVIILNLDQWIRCCVKSSIFSSGWVVLAEGLTRNVITNCMKLFPIWTSSSGGDVVYNISYLELWRSSWLAEQNHLNLFRGLKITAAEVWVILSVHPYKNFNILSLISNIFINIGDFAIQIFLIKNII